MPLPGGPADKIGNRYELWWTVVQAQSLLRGEWDAIRIEPPGEDKAEFVLTRDTTRSFHQAKRSAPNGKWSLAELAGQKVGVLQGIDQLLREPECRYVFISSSDSRELSELAERARSSESPSEFLEMFAHSQEQTQNLTRLRRSWNDCDDQTAWDRLRRIEVRTVDEASLKEQALLGAQMLFLAPPGNVCSEIRSYLLDSIHITRTREEIVAHLQDAGYPLRQVFSPGQAKYRVEEITKKYLEGTRSRLIEGILVNREITHQLISNLGAVSTDNVLTGRAGTGKTGCVVELVEKLQSNGVPTLAFRLDRIDPVHTTLDLGRRLGLDESPAILLAAAAEVGRSAVLVIDQLDAISTTSGRTTGFFDTVEALLREARAVRTRIALHVVVVCREFDWKNDYRLRKLVGQAHNHVPIGDFNDEQVRSILDRAGYKAETMSPRALELLRLPQNLSLFLESAFPSHGSLHTTIELYEHYWKFKRRAVNERAVPTQDHWQAAIEALVDGMTESQQLSVRQESLDSIPSDYVDQMTSEGVITLIGNRVGFGHESFFDYCFARQFVVASQSLVDFLLTKEQHLFRRAQVRQVLQYLHEDDPSRFCNELEVLVRHDQIRSHLKDLALAVAASSLNVSTSEWNFWMRLIGPHLEAVRSGEKSDVLTSLAWKHFFSSGSLFAYGLAQKLAESWIRSTDRSIADLGLSYLRMHESRFSSEVAELLKPLRGNPSWRDRLVWFMQLVDLNGGREMFDLFLQLLADGTLDDARGVVAVNSTFWNLVYGVADKHPERMCAIVRVWLRRQFEKAVEADDQRHAAFDHGENFADEPISRAARSVPKYFIDSVLPVIVEIASWGVYTDDSPPHRDKVWPYRTVRDHAQAPHNSALSNLENALKEVAATNPVSLGSHVNSLKVQSTNIANILLLCIFAGNGGYFAREALDLFEREPWRFQSGMTTNSQWYAQKAIEAIAPHLSVEDRARLEAIILKYVAPWEKSKRGYKYNGAARFNLLSAVPTALRSHSASKAYQELERKFRKADGEPTGAQAVWGGSPISEDSIAKMSDDAILAAIIHYSSTSRPSAELHFLRGGNVELARAIATSAAKNPGRFAHLALRIPGNASAEYLRALMQTFEEAAMDDELKLRVASHAFEVQREPCGREIANLLGAVVSPLPEQSLNELSWLALRSEDPDVLRSGTYQVNGTEREWDPLTIGINSTRGRAALGIGKQINHDPQYAARFRDTIERLTYDPSEAVLTCVAFTLRALAVRDYLLAWQLFEQCASRVPSIRHSQYGANLIGLGLNEHFALLRPTIEELVASGDKLSADVGANLACLAALTNREASDIAETVANGTDSQRFAASRIASANVGVEEFRKWCEPKLLRFFNDSDEKVRQKAGQCFRNLDGKVLEDFSLLIDAYCKSSAFTDNSHALLHTLEESVERLPGVVCKVCEVFLERFGAEARDFRTHRAADGFAVAKLVFRVYHQHQRDDWASRALDVIDQLCVEGVGEVLTQLQQFDR